MNETKECIFEEDQIVYCTSNGKGKVIAIQLDREYPVKVCFGFRTDHYTIEGKLVSGGLRTLFFSKPKVEAALVPPFVPTLEGKVVKVTDIEGRVSYIEVLRETEYAVFAHTNNARPRLGCRTQWEKSCHTFEPVN